MLCSCCVTAQAEVLAVQAQDEAREQEAKKQPRALLPPKKRGWLLLIDIARLSSVHRVFSSPRPA